MALSQTYFSSHLRRVQIFETAVHLHPKKVKLGILIAPSLFEKEHIFIATFFLLLINVVSTVRMVDGDVLPVKMTMEA